MNILCVIPARSGSERIVQKNLKKLAGKSLVQLAYEAAEESGVFTAIYISSDEEAMADGYPWIERPKSISGPTSDIALAAKHALHEAELRDECEYQYVVTLQPAVPLRTPRLIKDLVHNVIERNCSGGLTGVETVPWLWRERGGLAQNDWSPGPYPRSQSFKGSHFWQEINAVQMAPRCVVLAGRRWGLPLLIQLMPPFAIIDIDEPADLLAAESTFPLLLEALSTTEYNRCFVISQINGEGEI